MLWSGTMEAVRGTIGTPCAAVFRADWKTNQGDDWTLLGEGSRGSTGLGGTTSSRWNFRPARRIERSLQHRLPGDSLAAAAAQRVDYQFQGSFDYFDRNDGFLGERLQAVTLDFQNRLLGGKNHKIVWGLGARFVMDRAFYLSSSFGTSVFAPEKKLPAVERLLPGPVAPEFREPVPGSQTGEQPFHRSGGPAQCAGQLDGRTTNDSVGPPARNPTPSRMLTDTRVQNILQIPFPPATVITEMNGNPDLPSEVLLAYEAGFVGIHLHHSPSRRRFSITRTT